MGLFLSWATPKMRTPLFDSFTPIVTALGFELWWVEWIGKKTLQVCIDSPQGITLEDCEEVSRQLSTWLDVADTKLGLPASYDLQVSSPGADRKLHLRQHYQRYCSHQVDVRLHRAREDKRKLRGRLVAVSDTGIELELAEGLSPINSIIDWNEIKETRLVFDSYEDLHR